MKPLFTAVIAGVNYLLHPDILGLIEEDIDPNAVLPVTLISTEELNSPDLDGLLRGFESYDDVYSSEFAFALVEKPASNVTKRDSITRRVSVAGKQTYTVQVTQTGAGSDSGASASGFSTLPTGPYILHGKELHQAYRIYEDELNAFSAGVVPENHDSSDIFLDLGDALENGKFRPIAVPSRLYFPGPSIKKPLSGIRYSIPEGFDLGGLPTTVSSNNWTSLHPGVASKHAEYVKFLLDQGAIIVGKTKDGQFASGRDWSETIAPVNPRGDGKQRAGGASAGAGSAIANYPWLQNSITQGNFDGTVPQAAAYGLFSLRTTPGTVSRNGVLTSSPKFQSTGISGRSLEDIVHLIAPSFKLPWQATPVPLRAVYLHDFKELLSEKQQALMEEFIIALEKLGIKIERVSLRLSWAASPPHEAGKQSLDEYLGNATYEAICADFYNNYRGFQSDFKTKFGEEPYTEPSVKAQWDVGAATDERETATKLNTFRAWFQDYVPTAADSEGKAAIIVPVLDINSNNLNTIEGLRPEFIAPILGTPQVVTPFAQVSIENEKSAYLPFSAGLIGAKGDDLMLVQLMKRAFDIVDWRIHVDTGSLTYPVGNNSRAVDDHHQDPFPPNGPGMFSLVRDEPADTEL